MTLRFIFNGVIECLACLFVFFVIYAIGKLMARIMKDMSFWQFLSYSGIGIFWFYFIYFTAKSFEFLKNPWLTFGWLLSLCGLIFATHVVWKKRGNLIYL